MRNSKAWRRRRLIELLSLSGSPVPESSTDMLLQRVAESFVVSIGADNQVKTTFVRLNDLKTVPCQACGKAPTPEFCFYEDDITGLYDRIATCDCLLFGSPIYFDAVSGQAKTFIDRCNCLRPADFENADPDHDFIKLVKRKRPGAIILVGGAEGWFEGARRCIAGFFKWIEVVNEGVVTYHSLDFNRTGTVAENKDTLLGADVLGRHLAKKVTENYDR
jgi:multimeric flavodoxin WrbA